MLTATRAHAPSSLQWISLITAAFLVLPTCYIIYVALTAAPTVWSRLWSTRIPELLWNTLSLATGVALTTLLLGVSLAWITVRYEFPGRRVWEWALALPLAMPTYVLDIPGGVSKAPLTPPYLREAERGTQVQGADGDWIDYRG